MPATPRPAPRQVLPRLAKPLVEMVGPMPYPAIYSFTAEAAEPGKSVLRSNFLRTLDDGALDAIVERHASPEGRMAITQLRVFGGAMARVPTGATAFAHRDATVMATVISGVADSYEATAAWADAYLRDLSSTATGVYSNFLDEEGESRLHRAYPGATYERLVAVKRRVDPSNVFRGNHNIDPADRSHAAIGHPGGSPPGVPSASGRSCGVRGGPRGRPRVRRRIRQLHRVHPS